MKQVPHTLAKVRKHGLICSIAHVGRTVATETDVESLYPASFKRQKKKVVRKGRCFLLFVSLFRISTLTQSSGRFRSSGRSPIRAVWTGPSPAVSGQCDHREVEIGVAGDPEPLSNMRTKLFTS